jgi:hypothetical protein
MAYEWSTYVTVTRDQEVPVRSGLEEVDEIEIFKGDNNTLTMNQTYTHNFQCKYSLHRYPFDIQVTYNRYSAFLYRPSPELLHRDDTRES